MTYDQAHMILDILRQCLGAFIANHEGYEAALDMAMETLDKQIPQKPIRITRLIDCTDGPEIITMRGECPLCAKSVDMDRHQYCPNCGQALDWTEQEA